MLGRDHAAVSQKEHRVDLVHDYRVRNGVDLVKPHDLAITADADLITPANNVQMPDTSMVSYRKFLGSDDNIQVANDHVIVDAAMAGIDNGQPYFNSLTYFISEQVAICGTF